MFPLEPGVPPEGEEYLDPESGRCPLGDMCISMERVEEQAAEYGHSLEREVCYLAVHSILHLLGYDHTDEGPMKAQMRAREEAILDALGITRA
jgi:probable rRNA maturation factor